MPIVRKHAGFTLAELMATLAVSGVALSLAVPALNQAIGDQRRATAVNDLIGTLHLARNTAMTRNTRVTVCSSRDGKNCTDDDWESGWIAFVDPDGLRNTSTATGLAGGLPGDDTLSIRSDRFTRYLAYRPNGQVMGETPGENTGEFVICDITGSENAQVLLINASGKPRLGDHLADGRRAACPRS